MRWLFLFIALVGGALAPAWAEQDADALSWLERIAAAAQHLNYSGTFVYQSGGQTETSRITHVVDGAGQRARKAARPFRRGFRPPCRICRNTTESAWAT